MSTPQSKILRSANAPKTSADATELLVAQALLDLENNVADLKAELRPLQISAAREVDVKVCFYLLLGMNDFMVDFELDLIEGIEGKC